jgi:hypothetical protein
MRRRAIEKDLFGGRYIFKEALIVTLCVFSSIVAFTQEMFDLSVWSGLPYAILFATVATNETITFRWRRSRDKELDAIDADQARADLRRVQD